VSTAEDRVVFFDSMTDDVRAAIRASRCKGLDGTFETIECVAGHAENNSLTAVPAPK